jgi:YHS domain-containing protein
MPRHIRLSAPLRGHLLAAAFALAMPALSASAADEHFVKNGVAVDGYDVVAYHTVGKPTPGSAQYTAEYQGAKWQFASAQNRDLFAANPAKFAPAYGGWCAAGASKGKKVAVKPDFWTIVDGQLYLNSSEAAHTKLFLADTQGTIRKGEANWKVIFATPANKL